MKTRCKLAVAVALGRDPNTQEVRNIEQRISDAMKFHALEDPLKWQSTPKNEQLKLAAETAANEIMAEAKLKKSRIEKSILAMDANNNYAEQQVAGGFDDYRLQSLDRQLTPRADGKSNNTSTEIEAQAISARAFGQMYESLQTISPKILGLFQDRENELLLRRAMHGEDVGDAKINQAAKVITENLDSLRKRFNDAGANIGKLEDRGHAHSWSNRLFVKLGKDNVVKILTKTVDRSKYIHDDGTPYSDKEFNKMLDEFWLTVATDGANKQLKDGNVGGSIKANAGSQHRQIHFKDATTATEALQQLSDKNLWESIVGEVDSMAKNISLVERFGPNSDHGIQVLLDQYLDEAKLTGMDVKKADALAHKISTEYNHQAGYGNLPTARQWLADAAQGFRNLQLLRLGFSPITAISDNATMFRTVAAGGMSRFEAVQNLMKTLNPLNQKEKQMALDAGLMFRSIIQDASRLSLEYSHQGWTGKLGSAFMKATFINRMNEASRRAYQLTAMNTLGRLTRDHTDIKDIERGDHKFLLSKGIDQATWDIWKQADLSGWDDGKGTALTADAIYKIQGLTDEQKNKAASKLMAAILEETNIAVVEPGASYHAMKDKYQRGTWDGEFMRTALVFKSFSSAFLTTHGERGMKGFDNNWGKANYFAHLVATTWLCGIMSNWIGDFLTGKNPRNINPLNGDHGVANLVAGLLKGGGMGPYGELLLGMVTPSGNSFSDTLAGPGIGTISKIDNTLRGQIFAKNKDKFAAAKDIELLKQFLPTNLWYTKAAFDHLIFQELQEWASPGYLNDVRKKAQKRGDDFYMPPGLNGISAPNPAHAIGE